MDAHVQSLVIEVGAGLDVPSGRVAGWPERASEVAKGAVGNSTSKVAVILGSIARASRGVVSVMARIATGLGVVAGIAGVSVMAGVGAGVVALKRWVIQVEHLVEKTVVTSPFPRRLTFFRPSVELRS